MLRVVINSDLQTPYDPVVAESSTWDGVCDFRRQVNLLRPEYKTVMPGVFHSVVDYREDPPTAQMAHGVFAALEKLILYDKYIDGRTKWVISVEDKDPRILWVQHLHGLAVRWTSLLSSQERWKVVKLDHTSVKEKYQKQLNNVYICTS